MHLHEPSYHYLIPAALRQAGLVTVSSVQTNLPATAKVYGPEVRTLLRHLGADPALADPLPGAATGPRPSGRRCAGTRPAARCCAATAQSAPAMTTSACSAWWPGPRTRWTSCRPASSTTP